jgi:hypothetical protein
MSLELLKVAERAQREPEERFHSLAHRIDEPALGRAYHRPRKDPAVGVDGVTKEEFARVLGANLANLHERLTSKRYRHQALRRVQIPKGKGQWWPIGVSAFEDEIVQDAVREVLEAVYAEVGLPPMSPATGGEKRAAANSRRTITRRRRAPAKERAHA